MLTLLKADLKTGDKLTCEVSNNATLMREDLNARTLRITVLIDVHGKLQHLGECRYLNAQMNGF